MLTQIYRKIMFSCTGNGLPNKSEQAVPVPVEKRVLYNFILAFVGGMSENETREKGCSGHFANSKQSIVVTDVTEIWVCFAHVFENLKSSGFGICIQVYKNPRV